uniref:Uncharacterized protein n=1 Tax=Astyanax mexicanus TaxID=7994 RepID=A0A3B1ITZ5_ASTMX
MQSVLALSARLGVQWRDLQLTCTPHPPVSSGSLLPQPPSSWDYRRAHHAWLCLKLLTSGDLPILNLPKSPGITGMSTIAQPDQLNNIVRPLSQF